MKNLNFLLLLLGLTWLSCSLNKKIITDDKKEPEVINNDINITYFYGINKTIPFLNFKKTTNISFKKAFLSFKQDINVDLNMRNIEFFAEVKKNGRFLRKFTAQKSIETTFNAKKTSSMPLKSKLSLLIPFIDENEEVFITLSYEWMDIRWMPPIFLTESFFTHKAQVSISVPYGVTLNFKTAKDGTEFEMLPKTSHIANALWREDSVSQGLGTDYVFNFINEESSDNYSKKVPGLLVQLFVSFVNQNTNQNEIFFSSWSDVSKYIYDKFDRYDLTSQSLINVAKNITKDAKNQEEQIKIITSFLRENIEGHGANEYFQYQEVKPAQKTLSTKMGSPLSIVILARALLSGLNIESDILAVSDSILNPIIKDFYTPSIFSRIILKISINKKNYYFDPEKNSLDLSASSFGENALVIKNMGGYILSLP